MTDKNGVEINVGDEVLIRVRVRQVLSNTRFPLSVETVERQRPEDAGGTFYTVRASQVEKVP